MMLMRLIKLNEETHLFTEILQGYLQLEQLFDSEPALIAVLSTKSPIAKQQGAYDQCVANVHEIVKKCGRLLDKHDGMANMVYTGRQTVNGKCVRSELNRFEEILRGYDQT